MKIISISIIIIMLFPLSLRAEDRILNTKTKGKLTMVAILSVFALVVKTLASRDQKAVNKLHDSLGAPDKIVEFQRGFDHWRLEWYGEQVYIFRNGIIFGRYVY
jgi:hypothetical protein